MALIKNQNFAFKQPPEKSISKIDDDGKEFTGNVESGDVFENCNFSQRDMNTPIYSGKAGLIFKNCNLRNCQPPGDSIYESSSPYQMVIPEKPAVDPDAEIKVQIRVLGEDDLLRVIGKEKVKTYFNLIEV